MIVLVFLGIFCRFDDLYLRREDFYFLYFIFLIGSFFLKILENFILCLLIRIGFYVYDLIVYK